MHLETNMCPETNRIRAWLNPDAKEGCGRAYGPGRGPAGRTPRRKVACGRHRNRSSKMQIAENMSLPLNS